MIIHFPQKYLLVYLRNAREYFVTGLLDYKKDYTQNLNNIYLLL